MLSQDQLEAFAAVARAGNFTRAAKALHLSQPALSRRITSLEEQLETTVLIRGRGGATLTETGRRLMEFVDAQRALEEELLGDLRSSPLQYRGVVRIGGVSSLVPGVVLPALAPFLHAQPAIQIEIHRETDRPIGEALAAGRVDLAISQHAADAPSIADVLLGEEEFVMVESRAHVARRDVFLDVSPTDDTTERFLALQPARMRPRGRIVRSFMHDEAGILLGVELGLGRAVKPRHTIPERAAVRIDASYASLYRPVYLMYRRQRYYSRLHEAISSRIEAAVRERLAKRATRRRRGGAE